MAATLLATTADLDARKIEYEDAGQANAAIADASAVVVAYLSRFSGVDLTDMTDDETAAVTPVVVSIVRRLLFNPRGLAQEALGDYSYSLGGTMLGSLRPTRTERAALREAFGVKGASSIEMKAPLPLPPEDDSDFAPL